MIVPMLAALAASAVPVHAAEDTAAALDALVRARLAEEAGDPGAALAALDLLASEAPALPGLNGRILEQAIEAGDLGAARTAAGQLWTEGDRRFDAQLVLMVDAIRRSDWKSAAQFLAGRTDKTGSDPIAQLIGPVMGAWIGVGAREAIPERPLLELSQRSRVEPVFAMHAALVQLATRRRDAALALVASTPLTDRSSQIAALRVAATLGGIGEEEAAARLRARIALAAGAREDPILLLPDQPVRSPREGAAQWLGSIADGFARTPNASPKVALLFARAASWLNDGDWSVRSALVDALARADQPRSAAEQLLEAPAPLPPALLMRRAELIADAGDVARALPLAEEAAARNPSARNLLVRYAELARRSDDAAAADNAYLRLEASLADSEEDDALRGVLLVARAELYLRAKDWEKASPLMERAVALRPGDPMILNFVGYSAIEQRRDIDLSLKRIEAAHKADPNSAAITDSLGWAYFLTGRIDEAVPLLERAQRGDPANSVIAEHLGDAYWKAGRRFEARHAWIAAKLGAAPDMLTRLEAKLRDGLTAVTTAP